MSNGQQFEDTVRSVARALWSLKPGEGGAQVVAGQEIDCVCKTEDLTHLVMCTLERKLEKITKDTNKLIAAKRAIERKGELAKLWLVLGQEPIAEQRAITDPEGITLLSFDQFRSRLLDSNTYLEKRWVYRFGSVTDPVTESISGSSVEDIVYVATPITDAKTGASHTITTIMDMLESGQVIVLLGPFGAGKSLTVRELFREARRRHYRAQGRFVPLALNLRDHWGQRDSDEAMRRHAARIGFDLGNQLVRAWNAGEMIALLDGFDELVAQTWSLGPEASRRTRRETLALIRALVEENQGRAGILVSGRDQYFDTPQEMASALGLPANYTGLVVGEFTEVQAHQYLAEVARKRRNSGKSDLVVPTELPQWLPRKPLLLAYLTGRDLLEEILAIDGTRGAAYAWDQFLQRICNREARLTNDVDGAAVRAILEALAVRARETMSGLGPLYERDLSAAYLGVTGAEPLDTARNMLQRLPGLTSREQVEGTRSFVDGDMLSALAGGAVAKFVQSPYQSPGSGAWRHALSELGCAVAALNSENVGTPLTQHVVAAQEAISRWREPTLALDCLLSGAMRLQEATLDCRGLTVRNGYADALNFEYMQVSNLTLDSCLLDSVDISDAEPERIVLRECMISRLIGVADPRAIPEWIVDCQIDEFDSTRTTAAIMRLPAPVPVRVLLTCLRKLFVQKGGGRRESALFRGLDQDARGFVEQALEILRQEGLIFSDGRGRVWHANRSSRDRALGILASGASSPDIVVEKMKRIK